MRVQCRKVNLKLSRDTLENLVARLIGLAKVLGPKRYRGCALAYTLSYLIASQREATLGSQTMARQCVPEGGGGS